MRASGGHAVTAPTHERGRGGNPRRSPEASGTQATTANGTDVPGYRLLLDRLQDVRERNVPWPSWTARCPLPDHPDEHPSLVIDYRKGRYGFSTLLVSCRCRRQPFMDVCEVLGLRPCDVLNNNGELARRLRRPMPKYAVPLSEGLVLGLHQALMAKPKLRGDFMRRRGLTKATLVDRQIGYENRSKRFTIPIRDDEGRLVNIRRYKPGARPGEKMWNAKGHGSPPRLYPAMPTEPWVLLCEGELDALVALQHGLPAITHTGGVTYWDDTWTGLFRGRKVHIVFDCDERGRTEAVRRAEVLSRVAKAVRVVDLGLPNKHDVTDWFVTHGRTADDLKNLIAATAVWS
jgi:hypothetical protein